MKLLDALKSKRHYIMLMGDNEKQIVIGTDDLDEVSRQSWFKNMAGEGTVKYSKRDVDEFEEEQRRIQSELDKRQAENELRERIRAQEQEKLRAQQRAAQERAQAEARAHAELEKSARAGTQQRAPSTFLDIPLNQMNDAIWNSLTEEQQDAYRDKWSQQ